MARRPRPLSDPAGITLFLIASQRSGRVPLKSSTRMASKKIHFQSPLVVVVSVIVIVLVCGERQSYGFVLWAVKTGIVDRAAGARRPLFHLLARTSRDEDNKKPEVQRETKAQGNPIWRQGGGGGGPPHGHWRLAHALFVVVVPEEVPGDQACRGSLPSRSRSLRVPHQRVRRRAGLRFARHLRGRSGDT